MPLLEALHWRGDPRHVAEAVPHFLNAIDITAFRNIMATLHFQSRKLDIKLSRIDPRLYPCLFLPDDGEAMVLLNRQGSRINVFDGGRAAYVDVPREPIAGSVYFFTPVDEDELLPAQQKLGWFRAISERFRAISERFRSLFYQTLGITFFLNLLALATPFFVMGVYDKVVATGSIPTLRLFAIGVAIAIFHKILFLPPALTERATIGAQVARIKDFETIRDFFTGPMALTLFELPFVVISIIVIASLGGPVAFVPLIMVALYGILTLIFTPLIRAAVAKAARAGSRRQELVVETLGGMRAVKYCGAESTWLERFRTLSAKSALYGWTPRKTLTFGGVTPELASGGLPCRPFGPVFRFLMSVSGVSERVFLYPGALRALSQTRRFIL